VAVWCEGDAFEKVSDLKGASKNNKQKEDKKQVFFQEKFGALNSCKILAESVLVNSTVITYIHKN
jgi:hypothetical protein